MKNKVKFVGRSQEMAVIQGVEGQSAITAIYGRRRIGKTRLVEEACKTLSSSFFKFEGLEGVSTKEQKQHFISQLAKQSGEFSHTLASVTDWTDLLILLSNTIGTTPTIVFFDEFQWMANERTALVSKLKYVWDNYFSQKNNVHLILCGSVSSFIVKKVVQAKSLYGRIDNIIHLQALPLPVVAQHFFKSRTPLAALEYYLVVGGVPKYLELYQAKHSVRVNLLSLFFKPHAYFLNEFDRLFTSHFGKNGHYKKIVLLLGKKKWLNTAQIGKACQLESGGRLSEYLDDLQLAGFIEKQEPISQLPRKRTQIWRISDPYLRFYFQFVHPNKSKMSRSDGQVRLEHVLPDAQYRIWRGLAFESFCRQHAYTIAKRLGFSAVSYEASSWYGENKYLSGKMAQVDLLFVRADRVITLCEIKYQQQIDKKVIKEVEAKADALRSHSDYTIEKVLISAMTLKWSDEIEDYFTQIITAEMLIAL